MNTCKDCKWWQDWRPKNTCGECVHSHTTKDWPMCDQVQENGEDDADGDGPYGLLTGPDFGCVHWEAK